MARLDISALMEDGFGKQHTLRELLDAIDAASDQDTITYLTDYGEQRRIAAIVPVDVAEAHEQEIADALLVRHFARKNTGRP